MTFKLIPATAAVAGVFALGCFVGTAIAEQPHMQSALSYLKSARSELIEARANKGGHRANAIKLVDQAIDETREGLDFAR